MKKKYLLITFLAITSLSFSQNITGKWNFESILPDSIQSGNNLKAISYGDVMQINENGNFHYKITKENLIADGTWELIGNNLSLHYIIPKDTTRNYQITIDETSLVLNENGINFAFKKIKPITVATSGMNINSIFRGILGVISLLLIAFLFSNRI